MAETSAYILTTTTRHKPGSTLATDPGRGSLREHPVYSFIIVIYYIVFIIFRSNHEKSY
ncbi:hypothetical protein C0J52_14791 [Blattella germanica]|nr:hypothetical protein C0J52_14791 [Blattella germanica]